VIETVKNSIPANTRPNRQQIHEWKNRLKKKPKHKGCLCAECVFRTDNDKWYLNGYKWLCAKDMHPIKFPKDVGCIRGRTQP